MQRIEAVNVETTDDATAQLLTGVQKKMGMLPNIVATMANSRAVANGYLGFSQSLAQGSLSSRLREQIALVVGQTNDCGYCVSAHTMLGKAAGLEDEETVAARSARSSDEREQTALEFAKRVVENRGNVTDIEFGRVREAGFSDGEIAEIVANVALNFFTNYFNHVAGTDIDFPVVDLAV